MFLGVVAVPDVATEFDLAIVASIPSDLKYLITALLRALPRALVVPGPRSDATVNLTSVPLPIELATSSRTRFWPALRTDFPGLKAMSEVAEVP